MYGLPFLYEVSHGEIKPNYFQGKKVLVIGGGNVAFDAARTARRLGGETTIICLECEDRTSRDHVPADWDEVRGAWEEGIKIMYSRGVDRIFGDGGRLKGIECPACTGVYDENGLFSPQFDISDSVTVQGDVLIITVGQGADKGSLRDDGLLDYKGMLAVDPLTLQSQTKEWVFVGGDLRRIGFMVEAMRDGLTAAESIERYLRGLDIKAGRKWDYEVQDAPKRRVYETEPEVLWIPPEKRMHFQLFEKGFTLPEAIEEARRCLACGPCVSCKACLSVGIQDSLPTVKVNTDRCSGCGICVSVCYYDSAKLLDIEGKRVSTSDMFKCKSCGVCVVACPSGARILEHNEIDQKIEELYSSLRKSIGE